MHLEAIVRYCIVSLLYMYMYMHAVALAMHQVNTRVSLGLRRSSLWASLELQPKLSCPVVSHIS